MSNVIEIILSASDQTGNAFYKLNTSFKSLTGFSLGAAGAVGLASAAINKAVQYTKDAIEKNDAYVTSVIDMSRVLGINTEETSKLIQASDDLFISQEKLNTALLAASRQGIDVSISGLERLSNKYLALNPGVERAQYLLQTFGRSGADMGKLMEMGAEGIKESMNAVEDWMIVTKDTVETVTAYKQSLDAAQDANDGLKYSVANGTMPSVTEMNKAYANMINALNKSGEVQDALSAGAWTLEGALTGLKVVFGGYSKEVDDSTNALNKNTDATLNNAAAQNILAGTSRGSIYDKTYTNGTYGTSRGSIYDTVPHAAGGLFEIPMMYGNEGFRLGNGDTASGGEGLQIIPKNQMGNNDMLNSTLKALPKMIAREIRQLEKYG